MPSAVPRRAIWRGQASSPAASQLSGTSRIGVKRYAANGTSSAGVSPKSSRSSSHMSTLAISCSTSRTTAARREQSPW